MATTFILSGADETFTINDINSSSGGFWNPTGGANGTVYTDIVHGHHIKSVGCTVSQGDGFYTTSASCADAGTRISFWYYCVAKPNQGGTLQGKVLQINDNTNTQVFLLAMPISGVAKLFDASNTQIGSTTFSFSTGKWYRISMAYTLTSTTVNRIELKIFDSDGLTNLQSFSVTNATLPSIGTDRLAVQGTSDTAYDARWSDFYIDNSSALTDPGNIWVTAKRPFANGTLNEWTTQVGSGGSGYGSGHSPQVNERPASATNGWSFQNAAKKTEEYTIESVSQGDIDITGATIVDFRGWIFTSVGSNSTGNIIVAGTATNQAVTTSNRIYTKIAGSATYPSTATAIGMDTNTVNQLFKLYDCGITVAYIPAVALANGNMLLVM